MTAFLSGLPGRLYTWGSNIIHGFLNGLWAAVSGGLPAVMQFISDHLPHSPPKIGPLSKVKPENMFNWARGIGNAGIAGLSNFNLDHLSGSATGVKPGIGAVAHHVHNHAPITVDASHMTKDELMALMIELNESMLRPGGVPGSKASATTAATTAKTNTTGAV